MLAISEDFVRKGLGYICDLAKMGHGGWERENVFYDYCQMADFKISV
jgi:hypothetical protein